MNENSATLAKAINSGISNSGKVTIEFQNPRDLLEEGFLPFPIKITDIQFRDDKDLGIILKFYENLYREWMTKRLKS